MNLSDRHRSRSIPIKTLFRPLRSPSIKGKVIRHQMGYCCEIGASDSILDVDPAIGLDRSLLAVRISRRRGLLVPGLFWLRHLLVLRWQGLRRGLRCLELRPSNQITTCVCVFRGLRGTFLRHRPRCAQQKTKHEKYRRSIHHQVPKDEASQKDLAEFTCPG
jgi:hypothetical protein